jgi:dihydrofolate reductase
VLVIAATASRPTPRPIPRLRSAVRHAGVRDHQPAPESGAKQGGTTYTFVTDGIEAALSQARAAAGDKDVLVVGGANVARQSVEAGLLDGFQVHLVPILLGDGVRLFEGIGQVTLKPTRVWRTRR